MLHNFFFIRKLSASLGVKLQGWEIATIFSQNKNELVLGFLKERHEYYLRANLDPNINLLTFSDQFHRARKNSVDLYPSLVGQQVQEVVQIPFDRSFYFKFDQGDTLIFKLHGRRSNVIHISPANDVDLFRNKLAADMASTPDTLTKEVNLDHPGPQDIKTLRQLIGKQYVDDTTMDEQIPPLVDKLLAAPAFYIYQEDDKPPGISLLRLANVTKDTTDPIEACNLLFRTFMQDYLFESEKAQLRKELEKRQQRSQHYIEKNEKELQSLKTKRGYEEVANIIMANLHQIPEGGGTMELLDFYSDQPIQVKIKQGVKPQKHAENLYRKAKNQKIQLAKLQENIDQKMEHLLQLEDLQEELAAIDDFKSLRSFQKQHELNSKGGQDDEVILPYKERVFEGYQILIGKNAKSNDELTLRHAKKDDLWLHARDVPGSHVVIRKIGKATVPNSVIEKAAELAAYYSKRKTDSLCPVIVTPRKFIRKRKGAAPGEVIVDREEVVMVKPSPE